MAVIFGLLKKERFEKSDEIPNDKVIKEYLLV